MSNPAVDVQQFGQSIWLDYIHRAELANGEFQRRIDEEGILGVTSNPAIFQKAIGDSDTYDEAILAFANEDAETIFWKLAVEDIQAATELFRPIYDRTNTIDGYVSLEVSPTIANDTEQTIADAKKWFAEVNRPNLMIKIPATPAGIPAIEEAIASGINVNVTLIFSVENYEAVVEAYIKGLERRLETGEDVTKIASVASFFLSRIDVLFDEKLEEIGTDEAKVLLGQSAVANAKLAYQSFERIFNGERFAKLREAGAQVQRPLWASTGTKNPNYSDTMYLDTLIGPHTVNTVPPETLVAFLDHGTAARTVDQAIEGFMEPGEVITKLAEVGLDYKALTDQLQEEGVDKFVVAFEKLIEQVEAKHSVLVK